MAANLPVSGTHINHRLLIKITIDPSTIIKLNSGPAAITYNDEVYGGVGLLLNVSEIIENLQISNADLSITISGIAEDPNQMSLVLSNLIKGSLVEVYRAFGDESGDPIGNGVYLRYSGFVQSYSIIENQNLQDAERTSTITFLCNSFYKLFEYQRSGRRTTDIDHRRFYPNDPSMSRVKVIMDTAFNFGKGA